MNDVVDVAVVGAGFGGLSAALTLAERGVDVTCLESLPYAGGCASTFTRHGVRYEAGATLFSGLTPATSHHAGGFFTRALARHGLAVDVDWIDPVIEHRGEGGLVVVGHRDRAAFVDGLVVGISAQKAAGVRRFCARQHRVAELLWPILDDDTRVPALTVAGMWSASGFHLGRLGAYARVAPTVLSLRGKSLLDLLRDDGVDDVAALRSWCRSLCQISVQADIDDADAVFALCALDYVWRGTGHVRGGIGCLASALVSAVQHAGGSVQLARRARQIRRDDDGFVIETARGPVHARRLVLNLLPIDAARLLDVDLPARWQARQHDVDEAWGAVMLYAVVRAPPGADPAAHHVDVMLDARQSPIEGHHAFISLSAADEGRFDDEAAAFGGGDLRTVTVSTHVALRALDNDAATLVATIQDRLRVAVDAALPGFAVLQTMPGSPRTFARYTGRRAGAVGGVPRGVGRGWLDGAFDDGAFVEGVTLVGDSVFPGQSTLAVAVGGARAAHRLADALGGSRVRHGV